MTYLLLGLWKDNFSIHELFRKDHGNNIHSNSLRTISKTVKLGKSNPLKKIVTGVRRPNQGQGEIQRICQNTSTEETQCADIGCTKPGKHHLQIVLINKSKEFCDSCKKELENNSFVQNETSPHVALESGDKGGRI